METRITKQEYALRIAETCAERSEDPFKKVGCVGLNDDFRVISTGYNGFPKGINLPEHILNDREARLMFVIHAEINMLANVKIGDITQVACTLSPCGNCTKTLAAYGVKRIYFREKYERDCTGDKIAEMFGVELIHYTKKV